MKTHKHPTSFMLFGAAALALSAGLTACGGGSDDNAAPAEPADAYVGTWERCVASDDGGSTKYTVTHTKTGAQTVSSDMNFADHSGSGCTGSVLESGKGKSNLTVQGTATANDRSVYKVSIVNLINAASSRPSLNIHSFSGNQLFVGASGSKDSEGYPTRLDLGNPWVRR